MEADEESQLEAAIQASLAENSSNQANHPVPSSTPDEDDKEDSDTLETFDSDSDEVDYSLESKSEKKEEAKKAVVGGKSTYKNKEACDDDRRDNSSDSEHSEESLSEMENGDPSNIEEWQSYLGSPSDPESKLMLRLPDGSRDIVSMPSSSKLMVSLH